MPTVMPACAFPVSMKSAILALVRRCVSASTGYLSSYVQIRSPTFLDVTGRTKFAAVMPTARGTEARSRMLRLRVTMEPAIDATRTYRAPGKIFSPVSRDGANDRTVLVKLCSSRRVWVRALSMALSLRTAWL